jgi:UDP-N-acetylmuramoyl-tripeptide--D-alanyl-D-alanine ligase
VWPIDDIVKAVNGVPLRVEQETFSGISTDSRTIGPDELFIPLSGQNFDGHAYISEAYKRSRGGFLCEKKRQDILRDIPGTAILVDNTTDALLDLARFRRGRMGPRVVAITGSNGKTTTKEIVVNILKKGFSIHYNEKNLNNLIGVSKSILSMAEEPEICVFELGTNSKGEIERLARVTEPDISLITNIGPSHLEGLFSVEGVLEEKLSLFYHTKKDGMILINADDPNISSRCENCRSHRSKTYGIVNKADFSLSIEEDLGWAGNRIILSLGKDEIRTATNLLGRHNLYNIIAASAIAYAAGANPEQISEGIETFDFYTMRFKPVKSKAGYTLVDDTYNANPSSAEWAIKTLLELPCKGKRVVVLGDMKELGEKTGYYHRELGRFLNETSIPEVLLIGDYVKETFHELKEARGKVFENKNQLIDYARRVLEPGDVILVKGSRAAKMEEIVEALT